MDLENFPASQAARRMLTYVTKGWYDDSYVGKWVYEAMGRELDEAERFLLELTDQFFVSTATWGLRYHELKYGLEAREDLPYEERRALIVEKRDSRHPMNPVRMESVLRERFGVEVHVNDMNDPGEHAFEHPNVFSVTFVQDGNENAMDIQQAKRLIQKLKLSHTVCALKYGHKAWVRFEEPDYGMSVIFSAGIIARDKTYIGRKKIRFDGAWRWDGSVRLNETGYGWNADGLYGFGLLFGASVPQRVAVGSSQRHGAKVPVSVSVRSDKLDLATRVMERCEIERPAVTVSAGVVCETGYGAEIEVRKEPWRFDGTTRFDGSRRFDAEEYTVKL